MFKINFCVHTSSWRRGEGTYESKRGWPGSGRSVDDAVFCRSDPRHRQLLSSPKLGCMRKDRSEGLQTKSVGSCALPEMLCLLSSLSRIQKSLGHWFFLLCFAVTVCYVIISGSIWGIAVSSKVTQLAQGESNGCCAYKETVPLNFNLRAFEISNASLLKKITVFTMNFN